MVEFSMQEADRLGLKMGMHICDGFALAGGPWIKPEQSMQKVVYSMTQVQGGVLNNLQLPRPEIKESYYRDIATYAIPISAVNSLVIRPEVTVSTGEAMQGLVDGSSKFRSTTDAWVQYAFDQPFTAASMTVYPSGTNFQSLRWRVAVSDDGIHFKDIKTCQPARRGWQDTDAPNTYTLPETTAKYFRFYWTPEGSEPGAEDLDAADEVCVYAKLPKGFHIPTPVGNYSPDWAIAFNEGAVKHIYFIAETKGTMESLNLRPIEQAKISCAKKLFNEISTSNVKYHDVDSYQSLLTIMNKV
jgi:hypothetical protein